MKKAGSDPLRPKIDKYLLVRHKAPKRLKKYVVNLEQRPRTPGRFSPSNLMGCQRQAAFTFLGIKGRTRIDPDTELIFEVGNWTHHMFFAIFKDMQIVLGKEEFEVLSIEEDVEVSDLYVAGSSDVVMRIDGKRYVWDGKTIKDRGFQEVLMNNAPLEKHVAQLISYMKAKKITRGCICYINKDNQHIKIFFVKYTQERWDKIEGWVARVIRKMERREVPPRHKDCKRGNYVYERCPYAKLCYGKLDEEQLSHKMYAEFEGVENQWAANRRPTSRELVLSRRKSKQERRTS